MKDKQKLGKTKKYIMRRKLNNKVLGHGFKEWYEEEVVYLTELKEPHN